MPIVLLLSNDNIGPKFEKKPQSLNPEKEKVGKLDPTKVGMPKASEFWKIDDGKQHEKHVKKAKSGDDLVAEKMDAKKALKDYGIKDKMFIFVAKKGWKPSGAKATPASQQNSPQSPEKTPAPVAPPPPPPPPKETPPPPPPKVTPPPPPKVDTKPAVEAKPTPPPPPPKVDTKPEAETKPALVDTKPVVDTKPTPPPPPKEPQPPPKVTSPPPPQQAVAPPPPPPEQVVAPPPPPPQQVAPPPPPQQVVAPPPPPKVDTKEDKIQPAGLMPPEDVSGTPAAVKVVPTVSTAGLQAPPLPVIDYASLPMSSVSVPNVPRIPGRVIGASRPVDDGDREARYKHLVDEVKRMEREREAEKEACSRLLNKDRMELQSRIKELRGIQEELNELTTDAFSHLLSGIKTAAGQSSSPPVRAASPGVTAAHQQVLHDTVQDVLTKQQESIKTQALQQQQLREQAAQQQAYLQQQHSALQKQQHALQKHQAMIDQNQATLAGAAATSGVRGATPQQQQQQQQTMYHSAEPRASFSPQADNDVRARLEHLTTAVERTREDIAMLASMPQDQWRQRQAKQPTMVDMGYFDGRQQSRSPQQPVHPSPPQRAYSPAYAGTHPVYGGSPAAAGHYGASPQGGSPAGYAASPHNHQQQHLRPAVAQMARHLHEMPEKHGVNEQEVNETFVKMLHLRCIRDKALLSEMESTSTLQSLGMAAEAPPTAIGTAAMLVPEFHQSPLRAPAPDALSPPSSQRRQRWGA